MTAISLRLGGGTADGRADTRVALCIGNKHVWNRMVNLFDAADVHAFARECSQRYHDISSDEIRDMLLERATEARVTGVITRDFTEEETGAAFETPLPPELAWTRRRTARQLMADHPELKPPLISSILRIGETGNWVAGPKARKSLMIEGLALCIAEGIPWLVLCHSNELG